MAGERPTDNEIEVGGMQWQVIPPDDLRPGRAFEMVCFQDFGSSPDYPVNDATTVIKTNEGELQIKVDRLRNQSRYTDTVTFEPGTLRAIIDHVEAIATTGRKSFFGKILDNLSEHASYLSFRR